MKIQSVLLTALIFIGLFCFGQNPGKILQLKSGSLNLSSNLSAASVDSINRKIAGFNKTFLIIQFDEAPTEFTKQQLASQGIELLNYIPDNAYTASVKPGLNKELLLRSKVRAIYQPAPQQKMHASLANGLPPATSIKIPGTVDVWISFLKTYSAEEVVSLLKQMNADVLSIDLAAYHVLSLRISLNKI